MDMEKHLIITGSSETSWKDAITTTIAEASKTIDYLSGVRVSLSKADLSSLYLSISFLALFSSYS